MDNKIIVNISMFDSFQKIKVYSNKNELLTEESKKIEIKKYNAQTYIDYPAGNKVSKNTIKEYACSLEDLSRSISTLVEQENCSCVNLFGSTNFLEKIKKDTLVEYAKNYGNKNLIININ